jgi:hypothetical protein
VSVARSRGPERGPAPRASSPVPEPGSGAGRRRPVLILLYLVYIWGLVEGASWAGLWALGRKGIEYVPAQLGALVDKHRAGIEAHLAGHDSYMRLDAELGWTLGPDRARRGYRTNSRGLRASREYAPQPPPGTLRLAAFGDSFTHASGVSNPATWAAQLEGLAPGVEVLNFGIPASAPDQALLRYRREGVAFHPHVVLIGFMSENVGRMVNTFRPFYFPNSGMALGKPRFALRRGELLLRPNPLPGREAYRRLLADPARELARVGEHDYYYQRRSRRSRLDVLPSVRLAWVLRQRFFDQPITRRGVYNPRSEAFEVSVRVVETFHREALANGSLPVVVLFPQYDDLVRHRDGRTLLYGPLRAAFERRGLLTLDLLAAFERHDPRGELLRRRFIHYPPAGNRMVALYLSEWLREQGIETPEAAGARARAERERLAARGPR